MRTKKFANGEVEFTQASASAAAEAIYWSLFINNLVFLILALVLSILIVPSVVAFALESETTDESGALKIITVEDAVSTNTLHQIYIFGCAISVIGPAFLLSRGITVT